MSDANMTNISALNLLNMCAIVNRIKDEAEDTEQMADMINAEFNAYTHLIGYSRPYYLDMYDRVKLFEDYDKAIIGEFYATEEDYDAGYYTYIVPISSLDEAKIYRVEYQLV